MDQMPKDVGKLIVRARSGFGMYPLEGVLVTVIPVEGDAAAVVVTDETGGTPEILLELPQTEDRTAPRPFLYTVEAAFPGYQKMIYENVEIYPGVTTVLVLNLTALPETDGVAPAPYDREVVIGGDGERMAEN